MGKWNPPELVGEELQRTLFDVALGVQTVQGHTRQSQLYRALARYGYDDRCEDCMYAVEEAMRELECKGNFQTRIYVR